MNQSTSVNQDKNMRKVALTALAGTSIEWYDFFLYGAAAALIFPTAFFGEIPETTALILSLLTFAAVSYTHLRAHETPEHLVCRLLLEKKKR